MNEIRFIGAGMWRTGTSSLQVALEELTGQPCYKMYDVMKSRDKTRLWLDILSGATSPDWPAILQDYGSTLDWPTLAYWRELSESYPQAYVILSTRDPEEWWQSIRRTVLASAPTVPRSPWDKLVIELFDQDFVGRTPTKDDAIGYYNHHNDEVRRMIPAERLIEWSPGDGWEPLCRALGVAIPAKPFPHLSPTDEYRRLNRLPPLGSQ